MPINLEIETKSLLNKSEYKALNLTYKNIKNYKQINYYIASDEMLLKVKKYGLRIRKKSNSYELTLKVTETVGKTEINQEISRKSLQKLKYFKIFPDGEVMDYLTKNNVCDVTKLHIVGTLTTIRKDIPFDESLISIDMSKYNGVKDYELECESNTEIQSEKDLQSFLKINNIEFKKSEHNKLARFLKTLH